ncbi:MAG: hypothetical protein ACRD1V_20285 [Vicinamibacterales bacterium]
MAATKDLKETFWVAVIIGLLGFAYDWSGLNKWQPDLFFPKRLRDIWWHLPLEVAGAFVLLQIAMLLGWAKTKPISFHRRGSHAMQSQRTSARQTDAVVGSAS